MKQIEFEGMILVIDPEAKLEPGDTYIAERNTGPKLLTVKKVDYAENLVMPVEPKAYVFDLYECVKIVSGLGA